MMKATTSNVDREIRRGSCNVHGLDYGQERRREHGQHWSPWMPEGCPQCCEALRVARDQEETRRKFNEEELPLLKGRIKAETDSDCETEERRQERIIARAEELAAENRMLYYAEQMRHFAEYIARADSEDRVRRDFEKIEALIQQRIEERAAVAAQADASLQQNLDGERDRKLTEFLGGLATLG